MDNAFGQRLRGTLISAAVEEQRRATRVTDLMKASARIYENFKIKLGLVMISLN